MTATIHGTHCYVHGGVTLPQQRLPRKEVLEVQDSACIPQAQNSVKAGLLEALSAEPVTSVRRALSIVVATIAQTDVPAGEWPQLLPWLHHCTQSTSEAHRETALVLLCSLTETIGTVPADLLWRHVAVNVLYCV